MSTEIALCIEKLEPGTDLAPLHYRSKKQRLGLGARRVCWLGVRWYVQLWVADRTSRALVLNGRENQAVKL